MAFQEGLFMQNHGVCYFFQSKQINTTGQMSFGCSDFGQIIVTLREAGDTSLSFFVKKTPYGS